MSDGAIRETGVLGIFAYVDVSVTAVRRLREAGWRAVRVYTPVPAHALLAEASADSRPSPVRAFSLVGGITGTIAGFSLAAYAASEMHSFGGLLVGGKPTISIPAFAVVGFELTVLIGALATMAGFLIHARLPRFRAAPGYDGAFTDNRFGIFVPCAAERFEEVKALLAAVGAEEVRIENQN